MSQFAASGNPFGPQGDAPYAGPQRTSILAICSLVSSLICCIPVVTGVLGILLGAGALIGISSSRGRVGGRGLAIGGILLGIITTVVWVALYIGAVGVFNSWVASGYTVAKAVQTGDVVQVRAKLSPNTSYTDEQIRAFGVQITAQLGNIKPAPQSPLEAWGMYTRAFQAVGKASQAGGGRTPAQQGGDAPLGFDFDNSAALIFVNLDPSAGGPSGAGATMFDGKLNDIAVFMPDGTLLRLSDMPAGEAPTTPGGTKSAPKLTPTRSSSEG
ncbi:MAG: DUF4190 domain-containing protein [Phycisphaerales bacterium]|nr:DUF4190 domain-containing protein [Phycisphaerales bacterium]